MIRVLGLDLALCCGWSVDAPSGGDKPVIGSFQLDWDKGEALGRALFHCRRELRGLIALHKPETVAFEAALSERLHGLNTSTLLLGLCAVVELTAFEAGLECWSCDVQSVRKHFVGNGWAKKEDVMLRCRALGWTPQNYDQSDSAALWDYARSTLRAGDVLAKAART